MKKILLLIPIIMGCNNNSTQPVTANEPVYELFNDDSLSNMLDIIGFVDSANVVETVSNNITELKEKNEKLETKLVETVRELEDTKSELIETKEVLTETKKMVELITDTSTSTFELLPIKVPKTDDN
jgi:hypothetical protein